MANDSPVIPSHPDILGGTPVFAGTRVPVHNLFDDLAAGEPLAKFLADFPSVAPKQAIRAIRAAEPLRESSRRAMW